MIRITTEINSRRTPVKLRPYRVLPYSLAPSSRPSRPAKNAEKSVEDVSSHARVESRNPTPSYPYTNACTYAHRLSKGSEIPADTRDWSYRGEKEAGREPFLSVFRTAFRVRTDINRETANTETTTTKSSRPWRNFFPITRGARVSTRFAGSVDNRR